MPSEAQGLHRRAAEPTLVLQLQLYRGASFGVSVPPTAPQNMSASRSGDTSASRVQWGGLSAPGSVQCCGLCGQCRGADVPGPLLTRAWSRMFPGPLLTRT